MQISLTTRLIQLILRLSKAPTFSDHLARLRGLINTPPNELFRNPLVVAFCKDPGLANGAPCLALLNKAHHNKAAITYNDVHLVRDDLKRLRGAAEDLHGEFRRWRWREPGRKYAAKIIPLEPSRHPVFDVQVYPDLAAFTGPLPSGETQDTDTERFDSAWFDDKAFFYVKNENLGFAAPAGSLVVVECDPKPGNDRNLVIALRGESIYARRLLRAALTVLCHLRQRHQTRKEPTNARSRPVRGTDSPRFGSFV